MEQGSRHARKHVAWYVKGLPGAADFRDRVMRIADPKMVVQTVREFYAPLLERRAA